MRLPATSRILLRRSASNCRIAMCSVCTENQPRDGKYHRIQIKVNPPLGLPSLRAHWRLGYTALSE